MHLFQFNTVTNLFLRRTVFPARLTVVAALVMTGGCYHKDDSQRSDAVLRSGDGAEYLAHEVIVQKNADASMADFEAAVKALGGEIVEGDSLLSTRLSYFRVQLPSDLAADEAVSALQESNTVAGAERNYVVTIDRTPNDPSFAQTWGMSKIKADLAWEETIGSRDVLAAVSDTGVDRNHPDLKANMWTNPNEIPGNGVDDDKNGYVDDVNGWDFANGDADPLDDHGHGTHCSGTIGAVGNDGVGVAGVNWQVKIMALKFLGANGSGSLWGGAQSILYAAEKGAKVVNASWGCQGCYTDYVQNAIAVLESKGGLFVTAAGNAGLNIDATPFYPAGYANPNLVAVAATDAVDNLASFSNWGPSKVHLGAPGVGIYSSLPGNKYASWNGTSMAAPHVSGAAALYLSKYPNAAPSELKSRLMSSADPVAALVGKSVSGGRLNLYRLFADDDSPPSAPTALSGAAGSQSEAILSWNPVVDEDLAMYLVRYGLSSGVYAESVAVPAFETETVITDLTPALRYYFVVVAVDEAGNQSGPSNEVSVLTGDTSAPPQVVDLVAAPVPGGIAAGYLFAASSEASQYYRAENAVDGSPETAWMAAPAPTNQEEYLIVEFNEPFVVDRVTLVPVAAYPEFFPVDFDVELSQDGSDWVVVGGMRGAVVGDDTPIDITFPAMQATTLRLTVHQSRQHLSGLYYAGISEVTAYTMTQNPDLLRLMFTAPGDDPGEGRAAAYDIRYAAEPLTEHNFDSAEVAPSPMPSEAGVIEDIRVTGLEAETAYWFAMKAVDDAGNVSPMSNVALTATVIVPPGAVQDLSVFSIENNSVTLTWRAPGGDAYEGKAAQYELRYSQEPITAANFELAERFLEVPSPAEAGVREFVTVIGLQHKNYYYFAVRAVDDKGNVGGLSNVASTKTEHDGKDRTAPAQIADLDVYESLSQVPLRAWVMGASSHLQESYSAYRLTDGSVETMWVSKEAAADEPEWVTFDLLEARPVSGVRIHPASFGGWLADFPQNFQMEASADAIHWTPVLEVEGQKADFAAWQDWRFPIVTTRYLRLLVTLRGVSTCTVEDGCTLQGRTALSEVEVFGPTAEYDVDLVWVAPGDDDWVGMAHAYDLRHSTEMITLENFNLAGPLPIPPPLEGGSLEVRTVRELEWGIPHYFALKTVDDAENWSDLSNVAMIGAPSIPPSPIHDLIAHTPTQTLLELRWTAVGDDNLDGRASAYEVRYANLPITPDNWRNAAAVLQPPLPGEVGTAENMSVTGLYPGMQYFFAVKVLDDEGASSLLSNIAFGETLDAVPPYQIADVHAQPVEPKDDPRLFAVIGEDSGSYTPTAGPEKLLDGKLNTAWLSPKRSTIQSEYVRFDLEESVRVGTIRLLPAPDYEDLFPVDFHVDVRASDTGDWVTVVNEKGFVTEGTPEEWSIGSVWGKQVRLVVTRTAASNGGYFTALSEFEIIEDPTRYDAIQVSWTAPSDPEEDNVSLYDLRRDRKPINSESNYAGAVSIETDLPKAAGMPERMEVTGLENETSYCFAVKSEDSIGNLSGLSNSPCAVTRGMPPATTVDLHLVDITAHTATVSWTAPGDDGMEGQAYRYDIRVLEQRINRETWDISRVIAHPPTPHAAGSSETYTIEGLEGDTGYFIALRAYDEMDNESGISNNIMTRSEDDVPPSEVQDLHAETNFLAWGSLIVQWTAPGDSGPLGQASEYDVRVSKQPITDGNFGSAVRIPVASPSPAGSAEEAVLTGLDPEAAYYVAMKTIDEGKNRSALSNNAVARTRDEAPGAVADLAASAASGTDPNNAQVSLRFTAPGDDAYQGTAHHYDVRYSLSAITANNFASATQVDNPGTPLRAGTMQEVSVFGLKTGMTYYFALKTVDERNNISAISNVASTKTADQVPPGAVLDLLAETFTSRGSVQVTWTHTGDDGACGRAAGYDLRWSINPINASNFAAATPTLTQPPGGTAGSKGTFVATGLADEVLLHFAMKAKDDEGNLSAVSNDAAARTKDVSPSRISDLAQTGATLNSITVSWTAVGDDEKIGTATAYELRHASVPLSEANFETAEPVFINAPKAPGSPETAVIDSLSPSTVYYIGIKAVDERGNHAPISNILSGGTSDNVPPGIIDDLLPTEGDRPGEIKLRWTATGDDGEVGTADKYEIRYGFECITEDNWHGASAVATPQKPRVAGTVEVFTVKELIGETKYYFAVRAIDEAGNRGALSAECFGCNTPPVPPAAIDNLAGEPIKPKSVRLTWTAPGDNDREGTAAAYDIRYAEFGITGSNFSSALKMQNPPTPRVAGSAEVATVPNLKESTVYYFAIKTVDTLGAESPISNVVKVATLDETPPDAPYEVKLSSSNGGGNTYPPKAVTASSQLADILGPEKVMDEDEYSMWVSDGVSVPGPEWIEMELMQEGRVDRVRLLPNPDYLHLFPQNFTVEVSRDKATWQQVLVVEDFSAPSEAWMTFGFDPAWGKYVRVTSFDPVISYFGLYYTVVSGMEAISAVEFCGGTSLTWKAPGDDRMAGIATRYEVYYHTTPFDISSLGTASRVGTVPVPTAAGTAQGMFVADLQGEQRYYWALRAVDEANNIGPLSELVTANSTDAPPAAVNDLTVTGKDMNNVTLRFTATGDDGRVGRATRYEMRYATWSMVMENFPFATEVGNVPAPAEPGTPQTVTVAGLEPGTLYYFGLKVYDEKGNASYVSNVTMTQTVPAPDHLAPSAVIDLSAETVTDSNSVILGTVTARTSEQPPEFTAAAVIDGNKDTFWASAAGTESREEQVNIALAAVSPVKEMKIWPAPGFARLFPTGFDIEVSTDTLSWRTVFTTADHVAEDGVPLIAAFPVTPVKFIRLTVNETSRNDNGYYYAVIAELEVVHAEAVPGTVTASWTATGDDGNNGTADKYDLRIGACPFDFNTATPVSLDVPQEAGASEIARILHLAEGTYCLGLKVEDETSNKSPLSNVVQVYTPGS